MGRSHSSFKICLFSESSFKRKKFFEQAIVKKATKKNTNTLQTSYKMDMTNKVFFTFVNQLYSR